MADFWNDKIVPFFQEAGEKISDFWKDSAVPFFKMIGEKIVDFWKDSAVPFFKMVGEKTVEFWNDTALPFIQDGHNVYYVITGAVVLVAAIILACVFGSKASKKKKAAKCKKAKKKAAPKYAYDKAIPEEAAIANDEARLNVETEEVDPSIVHPSCFNPDEAIANEGSNAEETFVDATKSITLIPEGKAKEEVEVLEEVKKESSAQIAAEVVAAKAAEEAKNESRGQIFIYKDSGARFRFRFIAANGNIIAHGQGYTTKLSCKNGIEAVKRLCPTVSVVDLTKESDYKPAIGNAAFELYRDADNKYRFRLRSTNTQIVLASQGYTSKANCMNGIRSVRNLAANHILVDDTVANTVA